MSAFHSLEIARAQRETRDAVVLQFALPAAVREAFRFQPGQYLTLRKAFDGEEVRRNYSICSLPGAPFLAVAVKRVPGGRFSVWANEQLRAGDTLEVMPPAGRFLRAQPVSDGHYLAMAAGSGITPILSILESTLRSEPSARFTLVYGNRAAHAVMFREALEDLKNEFMTRFTLIHILSREQQDLEIFNGRIDEARCKLLFAEWVDLSDLSAAYLCGPQSMMEGAGRALRAAGIGDERIRRELFHVEGTARRGTAASALPGAEATCQVSVVQDGQRRQFVMPRGGQSVLQAALAQGVELPWSCQAGVCSTCRCKVTEGEVEMDSNFALEDYEVARGFRLACQSYPLGERLTIDYDQHT